MIQGNATTFGLPEGTTDVCEQLPTKVNCDKLLVGGGFPDVGWILALGGAKTYGYDTVS